MERMTTTRSTTTKITAIMGIITLALIFFVPPPKPAGARSANPPTAKTGAPGQVTCSDCHGDFTENDGQGFIQLIGLPASYAPGDTIPLAIGIGRTALVRWGFEVTALTSGNTAAGTLVDDNMFVGKQTASSKQYIGQTTSKGFDGTYAGQANGAVWGFEWIAPDAGAGTVTFYFAGIAANNSGDEAGDYVYSSSLSATEGTTTPVQATTWGDIKKTYR